MVVQYCAVKQSMNLYNCLTLIRYACLIILHLFYSAYLKLQEVLYEAFLIYSYSYSKKIGMVVASETVRLKDYKVISEGRNLKIAPSALNYIAGWMFLPTNCGSGT